MDALYSKLYDKYSQLKTKKYTEMDEHNRTQEEKFLAFTNAADELLEQYRIENERLVAENDDLRSELVSTRSRMDDKLAEYQKLLMEENHKKHRVKREKTDSAHISTISKFNKRKRSKERQIAEETSQSKNVKTCEKSHKCFFCKKSGHVKKKCPKFTA